MVRWWIYGLFILMGAQGFSQKTTSTVSKKIFLVGEPIQLTYQIIVTHNDSVFFQAKTDFLPSRRIESATLSSDGTEFEILDSFFDTLILRTNSQEWIGRYTVTAWDSGHFQISGPWITISDSTYQFDDILVQCDLLPTQSDVDLYDIREQFSELPPEPFSIRSFLKQYGLWLVLLLLVLVGFWLYLRKKKRSQKTDFIQPKSLKERTLFALDALHNEKRWEKGQTKEHFIELSFLLRSYLTSRYEVSLLEKTTWETKMLLEQLGLEKETVALIVEVLKQSDMVKFAKSQPELLIIQKLTTLAKQIVVETSPLEFEHVE